MLMNTWAKLLESSFQNVLSTFVNFIPNVVGAILFLAIGWLVGIILARVFAQLFEIIKFDKALKYAGVEEVLNKAGIKLNSPVFIGAVIKWLVVIVFLMFSLEVIGFKEASDFISNTFAVILPNVFLVATILIITAVVAKFADSLVSGSAKAADVDSAKWIGAISKWFVWVIGGLTAFAQTGIETSFIYTLFTGVVFALSIAFGLAFGIGGQDAAREILKDLREDLRK